MFESVTRRRFCRIAGSALAAGVLPGAGIAQAAPASDDALSRRLVQVEAGLGGRLGALIVDRRTGRRWAHRADERFPMNSTFKIFACAAVLARVDAGREDLERRIVIEESDLLGYAPVTEKRVGGQGMTLSDLCAAAATMSDNTAANLVLESVGGPEGWTRFMRSIGDPVSRLDRMEPELNAATPGDPRDTSTPAAITQSLRTLVFGNILSAPSRARLEAWLVGNAVGGPLFRAGLPDDWRIGDRTGAGGHGSRGIVSVIWPPRGGPVLASVYVTQTEVSMDARNAAIADIGRAMAETFGG